MNYVDVYKRIIQLDEKHRELVSKNEVFWNNELDDVIDSLLKCWVFLVEKILESNHDQELCECFKEAKAILDPDYMVIEENMSSLRDKALHD